MPYRAKKNKITKFLRNLRKMINDPNNSTFCRWTKDVFFNIFY